MNIYREMFVMVPILKRMLPLYEDAEIETSLKRMLALYEDAKNQLMIRKYADYFKK